MSFISIQFISFIIIGMIVYYLLPLNIRWTALLVMSYMFYLIGGRYTISFLIITTLTTYIAGILLEKSNQNIKIAKTEKNNGLINSLKKKKKLIVALTCIFNFSILFFFKYYNFTAQIINMAFNADKVPTFEIILPLAMSFYMFQAIGYIIDVYRNKYEAEKNVFKFALFISFFPQMVQGPISRFDNLGSKLLNGNRFSFDNLKIAIQLMMWGYLKKLIIADRASIVVNNVFNNYLSYDGGVIVVSVIFYCIQLYCDFSGGIDIARGAAKLYGVDMIDNFKRPIFATSLADFWRRWHISLGTWMKDYLFYPLSLSKPFIKLGKFIRRHINGKAGKIIPVSIVTFIVYFVIGIWHGASFKYIAFGLWNGTIITASLLLEGVFARVKKALHINDKSSIYNFLSVIRTSFLVLIGRYITRANGFRAGVVMLKRTFTQFSLAEIKSGVLIEMGLRAQDLIIILLGTAVLLIVEYFQEKDKSISKWLDNKGFFPQWSVMVVGILIILIFGVFRGDYIASEFIYKQF